jgi:hypothetical protein
VVLEFHSSCRWDLRDMRFMYTRFLDSHAEYTTRFNAAHLLLVYAHPLPLPFTSPPEPSFPVPTLRANPLSTSLPLPRRSICHFLFAISGI